MKTLTSFCLFFFLSFTFSCKKDKIETIYVPDHLRKMLPYTNGQIIRFANGGGNIIETKAELRSGMVEKAYCAGCETYRKEEYIECKFNIGLYNFVTFSVDNRPNIFMSIMSPRDNYQQGSGFDFLTAENASQPICNGPRQTCLGTVTLNGDVYNDVLEVISGATQADKLTKAYYTVAKGLIGFAYGDGLLYSLQ